MSHTYTRQVATKTAKKKCCQDSPRCKKCPVVLQRLADSGCAARLDRRTYEVDKSIPKKVLKKARAR